MGISNNIKKLRKLHDLSQKDLALIAGVTDKAVSTWEQGIKEPRMGTIQKIADHFGLQKSNIIEDDGLNERSSLSITPQKTSITNQKITVIGRQLKSLPHLTPKDEREIVRDLENMLSSLDDKNGMAAYNNPEDEEDRELLKASLLTSMRLARQIAKKKFTPKKYRK